MGQKLLNLSGRSSCRTVQWTHRFGRVMARLLKLLWPRERMCLSMNLTSEIPLLMLWKLPASPAHCRLQSTVPLWTQWAIWLFVVARTLLSTAWVQSQATSWVSIFIKTEWALIVSFTYWRPFANVICRICHRLQDIKLPICRLSFNNILRPMWM